MDGFNDIFNGLLLAGVPLVSLVLSTVQWAKEAFSMEGAKVRLVSMGIGIFYSLLYSLAKFNGLPVDVAGWVSTVVFGIALGLIASGLYSAGSNAVRG